jgi:hypothetical protein
MWQLLAQLGHRRKTMNQKFALVVSGELREIRILSSRPDNIPHKQIEWLPFIEEAGPSFNGRIGDSWVRRRPADEPQAPEVVSARQARLALLAAGLLDQVEQAVAASSPQVRIAWEYATELRRDDPDLNAMLKTAFSKTDSEIDALFLSASRL